MVFVLDGDLGGDHHRWKVWPVAGDLPGRNRDTGRATRVATRCLTPERQLERRWADKDTTKAAERNET